MIFLKFVIFTRVERRLQNDAGPTWSILSEMMIFWEVGLPPRFARSIPSVLRLWRHSVSAPGLRRPVTFKFALRMAVQRLVIPDWWQVDLTSSTAFEPGTSVVLRVESPSCRPRHVCKLSNSLPAVALLIQMCPLCIQGLPWFKV